MDGKHQVGITQSNWEGIMDKKKDLEKAIKDLNEPLDKETYYTKEIQDVGTNGRKVILEKFLKFEQDLIVEAKKTGEFTSAVLELADFFRNIDDDLECKLPKIVKKWEEHKHHSRFLKFDKPKGAQ